MMVCVKIVLLDNAHRVNDSTIELARLIGPNRLGSPDDEGRAIPRNVVITKHRDDG
jgi:hypothetical protein